MEAHEVVTPIGGAVRDAASSSLLDELQAEHAALSGKRTKVLAVPGYARLAIRYKAVDIKAIDAIQERARSDGGDLVLVHGSADIIARCCDEVLIRDDEGKARPLVGEREAWGDDPIRFDDRLAELLKTPNENTRQIVEGVFKVFEPDTGNDIVMIDHADDIVRWIKSGARGADEDF